MKYYIFRIFKFSLISKMISQMRYIYSRFYKKIKNLPVYLDDFLYMIGKNTSSKVKKFAKYLIRYFLSPLKYLDFQKLDFKKIYKYLDIRKYNFYKISWKINSKKYKSFKLYFLAAIVSSIFLYLFIPTFYSYDKLKIEKIICKNEIVKCSIKGKINYRFYPTPRIKVRNLVINHKLEKKIF